MKKKLEEKELDNKNISQNNNDEIIKEKENEISQLKSELDENKKIVEKLKEEVKNYENKLKDNNNSDNKINTNESLEIDLKAQNKKLEEDLIKVRTELSNIKYQLADSIYQKEMYEQKYKKYINKVESKLTEMGLKLKFKPK